MRTRSAKALPAIEEVLPQIPLFPPSKTTVNVKISDIPEYLHNSALYKSLDTDDISASGEIQIPDDCLKYDTSVSSLADFAQILRTSTFWGLDPLPLSVIDFCCKKKYSWWGKVVEDVLGQNSKLWEELNDGFNSDFTSVAGKVRAAIENGITYLVEYWLESGAINAKSVATAALFGRLDHLKLFYDNDCPWDYMTCRAAAAGGHNDCLNFAHEHGCPWSVETYLGAIEGKHLHCFIYAIENNCPCDDTVTKEAAATGFVDALTFAITHGCPIHRDACADASRKGHLECLQVIHQHVLKLQIAHEAANPLPEGGVYKPFPPSPWDEYATREASASGNLDCLMFLHQSGCPWDESTVNNAAGLGNLEMLQYVLTHDCPRSDFFLGLAAANYSAALPCVEYLVGEQGIYMDEDGFAFGKALMSANISVVQYLIDNGCPFVNFVLDEEFIFELTPLFRKRRRDDSQFDYDLLQCIECATKYGWRMDDTFVEFMRDHIRVLPLTNAYLDSEGW